MKTVRVCGEPSWEIHSDTVSAAVTRDGGHLAPVEFTLGRRVVAPFHVAPWAGEKGSGDLSPVLRVLRGDFFCMPFGLSGKPFRGEEHPLHGETANGPWTFRAAGTDGRWTRLALDMRTRIRTAHVTKEICLRSGQPAVYSRHTVSGAKGPMTIGHHATLRFDGGPARISTSPFVIGQVCTPAFENPATGGYSTLKTGATFRALDRVPAAGGGFADLSRYPARDGFEDLVQIGAKPGADFAWTAASFEQQRYVWFSLKDPRVLTCTLIWHSNGGRHYPPWNGRHRRVLGLEELTSLFGTGIAASIAPNPFRRAGVATSVTLDPRRPLVVNTIMGVAPAPAGFGPVTAIRPVPGGIEIAGSRRKILAVPLDAGFLYCREER